MSNDVKASVRETFHRQAPGTMTEIAKLTRMRFNQPRMGQAFALAAICAALVLPAAVPARADIVGDWSSVTAPAPPELKPVTLDDATTALLVLDFLPPNCGISPACQAVMPRVRPLLDAARAAHVLVIYTTFPGFTAAQTLAPVAPLGGEPSVATIADKFINTNLDAILKGKGIKTVVVTGVVANGAWLLTSADAAMRGYKVVALIDATWAPTPYEQQLAAAELVSAPTVSQNVTLSRTTMVKF